MSELSVEVEGEEIIVSRPGTGFSATHQKQDFVPKRSWADHRVVTPAVSEFRVRAFHAAVDKARELGWVV